MRWDRTENEPGERATNGHMQEAREGDAPFQSGLNQAATGKRVVRRYIQGLRDPNPAFSDPVLNSTALLEWGSFGRSL